MKRLKLFVTPGMRAAFLRSMRVLAAILIAAGCAPCLFADQLAPLTVEDISLMLRSGCSSEMIVREVSVRHFAGPFDSVGESELRRRNASQALLDALRANAASEEELAQARKSIADAKDAAQKAVEQQAADHNQSATYQKKAEAYEQYLAQVTAAQKLDERARTVLFSWSATNGFSNKVFSPALQTSDDQRRVLLRAQQVARQEFPRRIDGWRCANRINELMQDESFVRDALK